MSSDILLQKLKMFLPNNTANKLLTDDVIFIEEGSVLIVRFNIFNELYIRLRDLPDFSPMYKSVFNEMITEFLEIIYENGGIFLNLSDNKIDIIFTKELIDKSREDIIRHSLKCADELKNKYGEFVQKIKDKFGIEFENFFCAGLSNGKFLEIIFGNEKRKERVVLGNVAGSAVDYSFRGRNGDIVVSPEVLAVVKDKVEYCKRKNSHIINKLNYVVETVNYSRDKYLNLKTSIIKSFLPEYIYNILKDNVDEEFTDIKKGSIVDIEFADIHEFVQEYITKVEGMTDETEFRVLTDNYFFGLNKLMKKIFRFSSSFDGAVNKVELSKFGLRVLITFSFPRTFDNDLTNKLICVEEINKICSSFKPLRHKIIHFEDQMFASIVGSEERSAYMTTSEITAKIDDIIEFLSDGEMKE